ncbi:MULTISPECIES: hypothetical protein [unclassified Mesorhizobium]|uniref:hypothetical protein n=1 Tax=unclassified Mesorhizobium TaxID=325217 RepID=UPI00167A176A|nr:MULTISPECIES: hypothetical protein [unclassified Mesorhizobium]
MHTCRAATMAPDQQPPCFLKALVALAPHAVAEPRRIIDAGRQKSGQHALRLSHGALAGQQFLDQVGNPFHIASPDRMIAPGHLDQPRIRDLRGQEAAGVGIDRASLRRWISSVGAQIAATTPRTSIAAFMRARAAAAVGLAGQPLEVTPPCFFPPFAPSAFRSRVFAIV